MEEYLENLFKRHEPLDPIEFNKFLDILKANGIEGIDQSSPNTPYDFGMLRVWFWYNEEQYSVIFGYGSYGYEDGLLEVWNMTRSDVYQERRAKDPTFDAYCDPVGGLTAENVWAYVTTGVINEEE